MRVQNAINRYGFSMGDFAVVTERDGEMVTIGAHWWVQGPNGRELKQKVVEEITDLDVDIFIQLKGVSEGCPALRLNERNYGPIR